MPDPSPSCSLIMHSVLHPTLQEVLGSSLVYDETGSLVALDSNVSIDEALLLSTAVKHIQPICSVEVGLAKGVSTLAILGAIESNGVGHHVVCDPFQSDYGNAGIEMVRRAGLDHCWEFHRKYAEEVIPSLDSVQFAFIDASHLFDLTLMEFVLIDKKLEVGGVVGLHDFWMPSLQKLFRFIQANRSYEVWYPPGFEPRIRHSHVSWKRTVRNLAKQIPFSQKVFAPEFLHPWQDYQLGNLVLLRKTEMDNRDWRYFQGF